MNGSVQAGVVPFGIDSWGSAFGGAIQNRLWLSVGQRSAAVERNGECRCGYLQYTVTEELAPVFNCHCQFCRRIHGASFTTVGYLSAAAFAWLSGTGEASCFVTPVGHHRYFCGRCSSPIYNLAPAIGLACVVVGSLSQGAQPAPWAHINTESKDPNFEIPGGLPLFSSWPEPSELLDLARAHGARLPREMVRSAV
jgi:hypothetical protein